MALVRALLLADCGGSCLRVDFVPKCTSQEQRIRHKNDFWSSVRPDTCIVGAYRRTGKVVSPQSTK